MPTRPLLLACFAVVLAMGSEARAQAPARLSGVDDLLRLGPSARGSALGGLATLDRIGGSLGGRDSDVSWEQPGALVGATGMSLGLLRTADDATAVVASAARTFAGGHLGVGLRALASDRSALVGSLTYARRLLGFGLGGSVKYIEERRGTESASVMAADVGLSHDVAFLTLSLAARNLGPDPGFRSTTTRLPRDVTFELATESAQVGPLDVAGGARVMRRRDGAWVPGAGLELAWWPIIGRTFTVRGGLQREPDHGFSVLSIGVGYSNDTLALDYAFVPGDRFEDGHRIGIAWR